MDFMYPQKTVDRLKKRIDNLTLALQIVLDTVQETAIINEEPPPRWVELAKRVIKDNQNKPRY